MDYILGEDQVALEHVKQKKQPTHKEYFQTLESLG